MAAKGRMLRPSETLKDEQVLGTVTILPNLINDLSLPIKADIVKVIELIPGEIITRKILAAPKIRNGLLQSDTVRDILKIAVIERHNGSGNKGIGLVKGFGLKRGAIASSVAHDSHNIVVIGTNDEDMIFAVKKLGEMGGGLVSVDQKRLLASLPLPIAGLISPDSAEKVAKKLSNLERITREKLGIKIEHPFIALSFLALPVIPELKLTDKGLIDVTTFTIVPLEGEK